MKNPCEIRCIAKADAKELAQYAQGFDTLIMILPLYIHAMPGMVMRFIEAMEPAASQGKSIEFIIQAGFIETAQERFVEAYFAELARQLNFSYLGTVSKGEAAGVYMYPKMFRKLLRLLNDLGKAFEETNAFDQDIVKEIGKPYELSKSMLRMLHIVHIVGLDKLGWHRELKKNHALDKRLDRPFI
jgi:hypothetical protein